MRKLKHEEIPRLAPEVLAGQPRHPIAVVVDNVRSIHNVGSIFRTADALRIDHLYLTGYSGTPDHKSLRKTSLGAEETVPWSQEAAPAQLVERLKGEGYTIAALELTDTPSLIDDLTERHFPMCLVLGNELFGVRDELLGLCDLALELPQFGAKQSLNVAVAFGVAGYDLVRRCRALGAAPAMPVRSTPP